MKLHLCCGSRIEPGWTNVDVDLSSAPLASFGAGLVLEADVRKGLPFPNESVSRIYCEHAIEHFTSEEGMALFRECWRVLQPGGCLRFSTPDLRLLVTLYQQAVALDGSAVQSINPLRHYEAVGFITDTPGQLINQGMRRWGHLYLYDELDLTIALRVAGFRVSRRARHGQTTIPDMLTEWRPNCGELIMEASKQ
jgi:predicted SAM-dependent methyltransferase